ncbi:beta-lactamase/transpeptidase-like protein [Cadophora sp. MPI-SDFR-AT-0126]|nr:beta-lactamase/transpeptidase-like protein [Leotiomycetes sp. MPI-SDFR-AT-0126]
MEALEQAFEAAFANHQLPGVVLTAQDKTGKVSYSKAIGNYSYEKDARPIELDSTFSLASTSKLVTTIAALQSVDRGHFTLDEDITRILPEFKGIEILTSFNEESGEPILVPSTKVITLRHLLTHSSGIAYDHFAPPLVQYRKWQNFPNGFDRPGKISTNYFYPLLFEPGTSYMYGAGLDWAGVMVQRVNGNISLEEYMQKNIWSPLEIKDMTFHLEQQESIRAKVVPISMRSGGMTELGLANNPQGEVVDADHKWFPDPVEEEYGGAGLISSAIDFQKILSSIIANDGKLLQPATVLEMIKPQLSPESRKVFMDSRENPDVAQFTAQGQVIGAELDYGLGSCLNLEATPEGRHRGTISWSGLPNTFWWIDLEAGVSGTLFMALFPMGDLMANDMFNRFQRTAYDILES